MRRGPMRWMMAGTTLLAMGLARPLVAQPIPSDSLPAFSQQPSPMDPPPAQPPGRPGTLTTRDGHTLLGDISETANSVVVTIHGIASRYDRADVASVVYNGTVAQQFHDRLAKLGPFDLRGRIDLAAWASQQQRPDLAVESLQQARDIDPADRDVALAMQAAQRQQDLDELRHNPAAAPTTRPAATSLAPATAPVLPPSYRLLTDDEVNRLRQKELPPRDDPGTIIEFRNEVAHRYLARSGASAKTFRALPLGRRAQAILADGDPLDAQDVRILTDPPALRMFRQHLMPVIATACASTACHGGVGERGGTFQLFIGDAPNTVYTNFYIVQNYATTVDGVEYRMIDRTLPARSLLLEFALPADQTPARHPPVPDYRPRFRSTTDVVYRQWLDWITNALSPIDPDYQINVLWRPPTTRGSDPPPGG